MSYKILLACFILCSCSAPRMVETDLYFPQTRADGSVIPESEWKHFKENQIDKAFKEGSTLHTVVGNWYDPDAHKFISEPTYVVVHFYEKSSQKEQQIDSLMHSYRKLFRQQTMLRVDKKVKVTFLQ